MESEKKFKSEKLRTADYFSAALGCDLLLHVMGYLDLLQCHEMAPVSRSVSAVVPLLPEDRYRLALAQMSETAGPAYYAKCATLRQSAFGCTVDWKKRFRDTEPFRCQEDGCDLLTSEAMRHEVPKMPCGGSLCAIAYELMGYTVCAKCAGDLVIQVKGGGELEPKIDKLLADPTIKVVRSFGGFYYSFLYYQVEVFDFDE